MHVWWSPKISSQNSQNQRLMVEGGAGWLRVEPDTKKRLPTIWEAKRKEQQESIKEERVYCSPHWGGRGITLCGSWRILGKNYNRKEKTKRFHQFHEPSLPFQFHAFFPRKLQNGGIALTKRMKETHAKNVTCLQLRGLKTEILLSPFCSGF